MRTPKFVANWSEVRMAWRLLNLQLDLRRGVLLGTVPLTYGGCTNSGRLLPELHCGYCTHLRSGRYQCWTHVLIKYYTELLRNL